MTRLVAMAGVTIFGIVVGMASAEKLGVPLLTGASVGFLLGAFVARRLGPHDGYD